jgi:hypothetical protein
MNGRPAVSELGLSTGKKAILTRNLVQRGLANGTVAGLGGSRCER